MKARADMPAYRPPFLALLLVLSACGRVLPHGGLSSTAARPPVATPKLADLAPPDFIPADLELVVRLDLNRVREGLGEKEANELVARAIDRAAASGLMRLALSPARVLWFGLRVTDIDEGDRVIAVEFNDDAKLNPDPNAWRRHETSIQGLARHDAIEKPGRSGFARVYTLGQRGAVFVTPVELHPAARRLGQLNLQRGQPDARGLLSIDYRPARLSPSLEDRYPSLSALLRGVERVRAAVHFEGDEVRLEGRVGCASESAALKLRRFIDTFRASLSKSKRHADTLSHLEATTTETDLRFTWRLPRRIVWALLKSGSAPEAAARLDP